MHPKSVSLGIESDRFSEVAFSPGAGLVVAATNPLNGPKHVIAWSYPSGVERWRVPIDATVTAMCFARTGEWVATCELDGATVVRDIATGREIRGVEASAGCQPAVALDPERLLFFTRTDDDQAGRLVIWNIRTGEAERAIDGVATAVKDLVVDSKGERVAVGAYSNDANVMVIEISSFKLLHELAGATRARLVGFCAADTELVAYNPLAGGPAIHAASSGHEIAILGDRTLAEIHGAALSGSGRWLATSHGTYVDNHRPFEDLCLCIWDLAVRRLRHRIEPDMSNPPATLAFTADDVLVAAEYGAPIKIWSFG